MVHGLTNYQRRLSYRMEQLQMSIQELAAATGLTPSAIHALQRPGSKRKPKIGNRRKIADAVHADPDWLLHGYGPMPEPPRFADTSTGEGFGADDGFDTTDAPDAQATAKTNASNVLSAMNELRLAIALATCGNVEDIEISYSVRNRPPAFGGTV